MKIPTGPFDLSIRGKVLAAGLLLWGTITSAEFADYEIPLIPYESVPNFLKYSPEMNLGEVLAVAVNSHGHIMVLNHPGSAGNGGPLFGNATSQLLEFDANGNFLREIGQNVYGLGYSHSIRYDRYDNLWLVDKGANTAIKFDPAGYVTMNLGRRPEGFDEFHHVEQADAVAVDSFFAGPSDVTWDQDDNIYISDGYINSRVAKYDKHGNWIMSWGSFGDAPGEFDLLHSIAADRDNNIYVADRSNRRIQVFDTQGTLLRIIELNAPFDKTMQPVLGNVNRNLPDATQPWALCMTNGETQYLWAADAHPGRIYKLSLDGRILGMLGTSGKQLGQFNWIHGIDCSQEDILYIADLNNWRVQKLILNP
ncbi:MAG: peptidyl-alpha-hydroxyglycine alpha-amidating lyase family protein [Gammaproteobacteria bacterium]|nr:peptidyl-alpha-hydroxyglycine alpha-amidating lyase family protein [Gammaproteobacteria bacterium]